MNLFFGKTNLHIGLVSCLLSAPLHMNHSKQTLALLALSTRAKRRKIVHGLVVLYSVRGSFVYFDVFCFLKLSPSPVRRSVS